MTNKIPFADLKAQYQQHKQEINEAIDSVLNKCNFIMGEEVATLEEELSEFCGAPHTIACASGTDALLLALMGIDIQPGDEVITTPFSFIATAEVISLLKAKPVFVDIDPDTLNIDATKIAEKITSKTKAIIPVSMYGQPSDMDAINDIIKTAEKNIGHKIYVIEDAAQSFGATYKDRKSCNLSDIACTSFFPAKPLGCYGDGGAVFTQDEALAKKIKCMSTHGQTKRYHHEYIGINGRLDTIQAAILSVKLDYYNDEIHQRRSIADRYSELLNGRPGITSTKQHADCNSVFAQYTVRIKNRDHIRQLLADQGVPTAVHYPKPLHLQPCFHYLGYKKGDFQNAEQAANEVLSLPMSAFLKEEDQNTVVEKLTESVTTYGEQHETA